MVIDIGRVGLKEVTRLRCISRMGSHLGIGSGQELLKDKTATMLFFVENKLSIPMANGRNSKSNTHFLLKFIGLCVCVGFASFAEDKITARTDVNSLIQNVASLSTSYKSRVATGSDDSIVQQIEKLIAEVSRSQKALPPIKERTFQVDLLNGEKLVVKKLLFGDSFPIRGGGVSCYQGSTQASLHLVKVRSIAFSGVSPFPANPDPQIAEYVKVRVFPLTGESVEYYLWSKIDKPTRKQDFYMTGITSGGKVKIFLNQIAAITLLD